MLEHIGKLVQQAKTYSEETQSKVIDAFFNEDSISECVVILNEAKPIGVVTRYDFYKKIGSQYGYTIYMTRPVRLIMNQTMLIVESDTDVSDVVFLALKREQACMYDPVVVTDNGLFIGIVSIKLFLIELTKQREKEIELLKQKQIILQKINETEMQHSLMIEEKNQLLSSKNLAIKNLLDNAGQGFLSFGEDTIISEEYSYECINIFETPIGGRSFPELISGYIDPDQKEIIKEVFGNVFKNIRILKAKAYLSLLPEEIIIKGKNILLEYKVIPDFSGTKIMVILTDVTEKKELESQMARERKNLKLAIKAISNNSDISACIEDLREFFSHKVNDIINCSISMRDKLFEIYRAVHTFKGDFSQLCMCNTANQLHSLENLLSSMMQNINHLNDEALMQCMDKVCSDFLLKDDLKIITDVLGEAYLSRVEVFTVSKEKILNIETLIGDCMPADLQSLFLPLIRNLRYTCFKDIVKRYDDYLKTIANNMDKCIGDMLITGDDIYIDKSKYQGFIGSLVHIFKNMIDHGIETVEERIISGKPIEGKIQCEFRLIYEKEFLFFIRDDGRGIDFLRIKKMIQEKKVSLRKEFPKELSMDDLQEILFMDGFSTKDSVSIISGRGMGLGAVRSEIIKLGGEISITSIPGKGTEFRIRLPLI